MISGFNTDIEFNGTMYHVQTEDKGLSARVVVSLVYDGGTILASKRVSYDDFGPFRLDEKELAERVGRQHKLICAAVRAGRIGDLQRMTAKSAANAAAKKADLASVAGFARPVATVSNAPAAKAPIKEPVKPQNNGVVDSRRPAAMRKPDVFAEPPKIAVTQPAGAGPLLPSDVVSVVSEFSGQERAAHAKLNIELLGDRKFRGGERRTVGILICRGSERKVVADAQIMLKVLGSSFRPVIFHAKSDANGIAKVHIQLPQFKAGRAALLIRVISGGEEVELRRVVTPA